MQKYHAFLHKHKVLKGGTVTHTSIANGSYYIENEQEFRALYKEAIKHEPQCMTEKHREISPVLIDLDFKQDTPTRRYTMSHIEAILWELLGVMNEYLYMPPTTNVYVLTKPPRPWKDGFKDGVHIIVPDIVTPPKFQEFLRRKTLPAVCTILEDCKYNNMIEDIYDESVISRNHWLMYGSKKPNEPEHWTVDKVYAYTLGSLEVIDVDVGSDTLVDVLSIRNKFYPTQQKKPLPEDPIEQDDVESIQSTSSFVSDTTSGEYLFVKELLKLLSPTRADAYKSWISVGWCLHNMDQSPQFLALWKEFSMISNKYTEGECERLWWQMRKQGLNIGTLCMWAREDNPEGYIQARQRSIDVLLDKSLSGTHTDIAKVVHRLFKDDYICTTIRGNAWYEFKSHRWVPIESAYSLRRQISGAISDMYTSRGRHYKEMAGRPSEHQKEYEARSDKFTKHAKNLKMTSFKDCIVKEMAELFYDPEVGEKLDEQPNLLCFNNGVYDLSKHEFRNGQPSDYATMTVGYDFADNDDPCVQGDIMSFLASIVENDIMKDYMLKVLAYMMDGNKYLEQLWFFTGSGRNGKGTLCELLCGTLGDYYYEPDISIVTTTKKSSSAANPELAKAKGKRVLVASEPDDTEKDGRFKANKLKQFRGNDLIQARGLYKECIEFKPQFGMIFQMNDKPLLTKVDDAIARSLNVVDFPYQFVSGVPITPDQRAIDTTLKHKFKRVEYRQQFMRILCSYHERFVNGNQDIEAPHNVKSATAEYISENNPLKDWFENNYEIVDDDKARVSVDTMYTEYAPRSFGFTKKLLGRYMKMLGIFSRVSSGVRYYYGVRRKCSIVDAEVPL